MLSYTLQLNKCFQKKSIDLHEATNIMKDTLNILSKCRENVSSQFIDIYKLAESMAKIQKVDLKIPRVCSRQTNRANFPTNNVEEYYKFAIFIPLLDNVINDLKARFSQKTLECFNLSYILPTKFINENTTLYSLNKSDIIIKALADDFQALLSHDKDMVLPLLRSKFRLWKQKWNREQHFDKFYVRYRNT
ncbi:hypothetical protein QTP88_026614 [Uroleucon formosanum]